MGSDLRLQQDVWRAADGLLLVFRTSPEMAEATKCLEPVRKICLNLVYFWKKLYICCTLPNLSLIRYDWPARMRARSCGRLCEASTNFCGENLWCWDGFSPRCMWAQKLCENGGPRVVLKGFQNGAKSTPIDGYNTPCVPVLDVCSVYVIEPDFNNRSSWCVQHHHE